MINSHLKPSRRTRLLLLLTRLATFSGLSSGCKNSAVRSIADWAPGTVAGLGAASGAGSSLSSSSSIKAGSAIKGNCFVILKWTTGRIGCIHKYTRAEMSESNQHSPILTFFPSVYCSWRGRLRGSRGTGVERVISLCGIPRSSSKVLIWPWNSRLQGCLRTDTRCSFRFFLTLLTWDLARVGGRFATKRWVHRGINLNAKEFNCSCEIHARKGKEGHLSTFTSVYEPLTM